MIGERGGRGEGQNIVEINELTSHQSNVAVTGPQKLVSQI